MAGIQSNQTRPKFIRLIHSQRLITVLAGISFLRAVSRQEVRRG
ncbi:hypothetical protein Xmau_03492 [Xenorhabdus mauleonii]|uniref:Uncharacterized protein n=1 Tax=Xenorhabdus mauleonii TaxID=351675 RepID=A0A1I3XKY0_9GAMM|nr:hypothetical protein [Xenorhabdus mauleonii]PHM38433.1 hypothetical protein Xmau_03492 [Xenorhabdus mauleonii]SFK20277.1 hypothetical protein SAMN05421680_13623 [Xenorhabdus mauleonii]